MNVSENRERRNYNQNLPVSELCCVSCVYEVMTTRYKINTNFYKI